MLIIALRAAITLLESIAMQFSPAKRPFAAPEPMWPVRDVAKEGRRTFDVVFAADFRISGHVSAHALEQIAQALRQDRSVGLIQMSRYDHDPMAPILSAFHDLDDQGEVQFIVAGEHVTCEELLILDPRVLEDFQRFVPDVEAQQISISSRPEDRPEEHAVLDNEGAFRKNCEENLKRYFGSAGTWR